MSDEQRQPESDTTPTPVGGARAACKPARTPRSRRRRFVVRVLVGVLLGLPIAVVALTQGPIAEWAVRRMVRGAMGAEFNADWVSLKPDGRVVITKMTLDAPGLQGPEARVVAAERVEIELEWKGFLGLSTQVSQVRVDQPVVRLSVSPQGEFNLSRILMPSSTGAPATLPRILVDRGAIELSEHDAGAPTPAERFRLMARAEVTGSVAPVKPGSDQFLIDFRQVGGSPLGAGGDLRVGGHLSLKTGEGAITISGVDLSKWTVDRVPSAIREPWAKMNMQGQVSGAVVTFSRDGALAVEIDTRDVSLYVPVAAGPTETVGERYPFVTGVHGTLRFFQGPHDSGGIEADLTGLFEYDVPCRIIFHSDGITLNAPYSAEIIANDFEMDPTLRVWWLAPPSVIEIVDMFGGPKAKVDARISIKRAEDDDATITDADISGTVAFTDGAARFARFPYPLSQLKGHVVFDKHEVKIESMSGVGPESVPEPGAPARRAKMFAEGRFAPPTDLAAVNLTLTLVDLPFDGALKDAIAASSGKDLLKSIFSEDRLRELEERGLVVSDERRDVITAELAAAAITAGHRPAHPSHWERLSRLMEAAQAPVFELVGDASQVVINVTRAFGETSPYLFTVDVQFSELTLLPEVFAFPLLGENVRLTISDDAALLKADVLRGLEGGTASLDAKVDIISGVDPDEPPEYAATVKVEAKGIPITPLLINAVPEDAARIMDGLSQKQVVTAVGPAGTSLVLSPQRLLRDLGVQGVVDCTANVLPAPGGAQTFNVDVKFNGLTARPVDQDPAHVVTASGVSGHLIVTDRGLDLERISGVLSAARAGAPGEPASAPAESGTFTLSGDTVFGDAARNEAPSIEAQLQTRRLDLGAPVETFVRILSPDAAELIEALRHDHQPSGRVDANVRVGTMRHAPAGAPPGARPIEASVTLLDTHDLAFNALGGRLQVDQHKGTALVRVTQGAGALADAQTALDFDGFQVQLGMDNERALTVAIDGAGTLSPRDAAPDDPDDVGLDLLIDAPVRGMVAAGILESALTRKLITLVGGEHAGRLVTDLQLRGVIESEFDLKPDTREGAPPGAWGLHAAIWPGRLAISTEHVTAIIPEVRGRMTIDGTSGSLDGLQLLAGPWTVTLDGAWAFREGGGTPVVDVEAAMWFTADDLSTTLLTLAPPVVREAADSLRVRAPGGVSMQDARVRVSLDEAGVRAVDFDGALRFADASADMGIDIDGVTGQLGVRVVKAETDAHAAVAIDLAAEALRASGVDVADAHAAIRIGGGDDDVVRVERFDGACYGGRIAGHAFLLPPGAPGLPRRYEARVQVGGVRVNDMLLALRRAAGAPTQIADASLGVFGPGRPGEAGAEPAAPEPIVADERRGWMDAELSMMGVAGDDRTRQGRGTMRITGGDVLNMPLAVQLIQIGNLQLPLGDRLDYFHASFWMDGPTVRFDQLGLLSTNLAIMGTGEMKMPDLDLDLTLSSQSRMRLPLVSDLFEIVRNEFVMARVTGTLDEPSIGAEPLHGTRAIIGGIFGAPMPEDPARERARMERERERSPWLSPTARPEPGKASREP